MSDITRFSNRGAVMGPFASYPVFVEFGPTC
jgi:hypothetical protein